MKKEEFYKMYIPVLEKALQNASINLGFYVQSPEDCLENEIAIKIDYYLAENEEVFLEKANCYFDAISHSFSSIQGVEIDLYKAGLVDEMLKIKKEFSIN